MPDGEKSQNWCKVYEECERKMEDIHPLAAWKTPASYSKALSVLRLVPQRAKIEPLVVKIAPIFLLNTTKAQQMCRKHIYSREEKSEPGLSNAAVTEEFSIFFFGLSRKNIEFSPHRCISTNIQTSLKNKKKNVSRAQTRK